MFDTNIKQFRIVAKIEGISLLILLFIAMPLKYMMGIPEATKMAGMLHGGLFLWFIYSQFLASKSENWDIKFNIFAFTMSLIPFGTFYLDKKLKQIIEEK